jgi:hypothetical protein
MNGRNSFPGEIAVDHRRLGKGVSQHGDQQDSPVFVFLPPALGSIGVEAFEAGDPDQSQTLPPSAWVTQSWVLSHIYCPP